MNYQYIIFGLVNGLLSVFIGTCVFIRHKQRAKKKGLVFGDNIKHARYLMELADDLVKQALDRKEEARLADMDRVVDLSQVITENMIKVAEVQNEALRKLYSNLTKTN